MFASYLKHYKRFFNLIAFSLDTFCNVMNASAPFQYFRISLLSIPKDSLSRRSILLRFKQQINILLFSVSQCSIIARHIFLTYVQLT